MKPECDKCGRPVAIFLLNNVNGERLCPTCDPYNSNKPLMFKSPPMGRNYDKHMSEKRSRLRKRSDRQKKRR